MLEAKYYQTSGTPAFINQVLTAEQWRSYLADYPFGPVSPGRIVLHHTWRPTVASWRGLSTMRGMQRYYAGLGWTAGPHIYTAPDGIWLATPMKTVGIHAGTGNSGVWNGKWSYSIGVEMVGNYDQERPSGAVWHHTLEVLGGLVTRLKLNPDRDITFHRDYTNKKSCPGRAVTKSWVINEVKNWLAGQPGVWEVVVTAVPYLRVRQGRGTDYPVAGRLSYGERVIVDDDTDGWLHLANGLGFIYKKYTRR